MSTYKLDKDTTLGYFRSLATPRMDNRTEVFSVIESDGAKFFGRRMPVEDKDRYGASYVLPGSGWFRIQEAGTRFPSYFYYVGEPYAVWAVDSAYRMLKDRDISVLTNGGIVDVTWTPSRISKWKEYFKHSLKQFQDDADRLSRGEPVVLRRTADGLTAYTPDMLRKDQLGSDFKDIREQNQRILDILLGSGLSDSEVRKVTESLPVDPLAERVVENIIDQHIPYTGNEFKPPAVVNVIPGRLEDAVLPNLNRDRIIAIDPGRPFTPDNVASGDVIAEAIGRDAARIDQGNPAEYRKDDEQEARQKVKLTDFQYWRTNHPDVYIIPEKNPHLDPRLLSYRWNSSMGSPPIVYVTIKPKQKLIPDPPWLSGKMGQFLGAVLNVIPVVGQVGSLAVGLAGAASARSWASSFETPTHAFEPQYAPQEFDIILPIDRAQIAVTHPEYAAALFEQFRQEIAAGQLAEAAASFRALTGKNIPNLGLPELSRNVQITIEGTNTRNPLFRGDNFITTTSPPAVEKKNNTGAAIAALAAAAYFLS